MRFVLQCEGEQCNKSPLNKSMKYFAVWHFQIKKKCILAVNVTGILI